MLGRVFWFIKETKFLSEYAILLFNSVLVL
jgi:hypothetical protein